jgi:hypothetical protein
MNGKFPFRAWYYFRTGYITYLAFIFAVVNTLVTVYYLAIKNVPALEVFFPSFAIWALVITIVVVPLGVFFGWLHLKRSPAYRSELDVAVESNPYYYKLPPGFWREALAPAMLELLRLNVKHNREQLTEDEINALESLQKKLRLLIDGGYVGEPKSTTWK